jgi:hypothetical protein
MEVKCPRPAPQTGSKPAADAHRDSIDPWLGGDVTIPHASGRSPIYPTVW